MSTNTGLTPNQPLRKLPVSIPASDAAPDQLLIQKVATAGDGQIIPFSKERLIPAGSPAVQILGANPNRKAVLLRAAGATASYLVLGKKTSWPPVVDSTNRVGVFVIGQEALTLETTDEIWVYNLAGVSVTIIGCEIMQSAVAK